MRSTGCFVQLVYVPSAHCWAHQMLRNLVDCSATRVNCTDYKEIHTRKSVSSPSDNGFLLFYDAEPAVLFMYCQIRYDKMIVTDESAYRLEEASVICVKVLCRYFDRKSKEK
jgi:hypothetical protein